VRKAEPVAMTIIIIIVTVILFSGSWLLLLENGAEFHLTNPTGCAGRWKGKR
jgi:hypothetical protein